MNNIENELYNLKKAFIRVIENRFYMGVLLGGVISLIGKFSVIQVLGIVIIWVCYEYMTGVKQ